MNQNPNADPARIRRSGEDAVVAEPDAPADNLILRPQLTDDRVGDPDDGPTPDSGFFGVGSNSGEDNDNLARETEPGYQRDKGDRGTIMPH